MHAFAHLEKVTCWIKLASILPSGSFVSFRKFCFPCLNLKVDSPLFAATVAAAALLHHYQVDPVHQPLLLRWKKVNFRWTRNFQVVSVIPQSNYKYYIDFCWNIFLTYFCLLQEGCYEDQSSTWPSIPIMISWHPLWWLSRWRNNCCSTTKVRSFILFKVQNWHFHPFALYVDFSGRRIGWPCMTHCTEYCLDCIVKYLG